MVDNKQNLAFKAPPLAKEERKRRALGRIFGLSGVFSVIAAIFCTIKWQQGTSYIVGSFILGACGVYCLFRLIKLTQDLQARHQTVREGIEKQLDLFATKYSLDTTDHKNLIEGLKRINTDDVSPLGDKELARVFLLYLQ